MGMIQKVHYVAYRGKDAQQTVQWYKKYLNMDYLLRRAAEAKDAMLDKWVNTRRATKQARWLHDGGAARSRRTLS